jgi:hypothetical protein
LGQVKARPSNHLQTLQNLITILAGANVRQVMEIVQLNEVDSLYDLSSLNVKSQQTGNKTSPIYGDFGS